MSDELRFRLTTSVRSSSDNRASAVGYFLHCRGYRLFAARRSSVRGYGMRTPPVALTATGLRPAPDHGSVGLQRKLPKNLVGAGFLTPEML